MASPLCPRFAPSTRVTSGHASVSLICLLSAGVIWWSVKRETESEIRLIFAGHFGFPRGRGRSGHHGCAASRHHSRRGERSPDPSREERSRLLSNPRAGSRVPHSLSQSPVLCSCPVCGGGCFVLSFWFWFCFSVSLPPSLPSLSSARLPATWCLPER